MQPIVLDIRTLSVITIFIAFLLSAGLFLFGTHQKKIKGIKTLAYACASYAIGLLLIAFQDVLPQFISIIIGNILTTMGMALIFEASCQILRLSKDNCRISIIIMFFYTVLLILVTYTFPSDYLSTIFRALTTAALSFLCARLFFRDRRVYWKAPKSVLKIVLTVFGFYQILKIIWRMGERVLAPLMPSETLNYFEPFLIIFLITGVSICFFWMVSSKYENWLERLVEQDHLTKIFNMTGVKMFADVEFTRMRRTGLVLSVITIDIDNFQKINSIYGQDASGQILKSFARLVVHILRPYDIFGRIGEDKFIIVLPKATPEQSQSVAQRIKDLMANHIFKAGEKEIQITACFGLASSNPEVKTLEELIAFADEALNHSERKGPNTTTQYSEIS